MATYSIREFKANVTRILRSLDEGDEVIITRRGTPCGRLTSIPSQQDKASLGTLRGSMGHLPEASYEDFLEIKSIWEPPSPGVIGSENDVDE